MEVGLGAADGEFLERDSTFRFEADIDQRRIVFEGDDPAFDDSAFEAAGDPERFIEKCCKTLLRRRLPGL